MASAASCPRIITPSSQHSCDSQVCNLVRQMLLYAAVSGCRYGLLTYLIHLIAFRFLTMDVPQEVCCKPALGAGQCAGSHLC